MTALPRTAARIRLRRLRPDDLSTFQAYRSDPQVARYQGWDRMDDARAQAFLSAMETTAPFPQGGWWQIGIARGEDNVLIGDLGLCLSADGTEVELGITLARAAQGQGLGQEAVQTAARYIFDATDAARILVITDARNTGALALVARLGLRQIDTLRDGDLVEPVFELRRPA
ncbi:GNAT family N-acetyltransferase [Jannaschia sp. M317]|uniref:GNAT family N-acetyltransferase n=1 Tax=Jannaschia sp. M317 TaxID=2867011 RepID=UPI0021A6A801|nr:GNAT family N-acetyltransferase [Jannaschia sp. M317]UWQ19139.1 GNAT family N-acetyltransferase [Jannaschia sp. M317]